MPIQTVTASAADPIHLTEAKNHLRVNESADDALITALIASARMASEDLTGKSMIVGRFRYVLDSFPGPSLYATQDIQTYSLPAHAILLPVGPVVQIVSIQYLDMAGTLQTMPSADYTYDTSIDPVRITPVFGKIWPVTLPQIGAVMVTFDAGYAAPISADATGNTVAVRGWKSLVVNDAVRFSNSGGALPAPLVANTDYYIQSVVSAGVYTLAATVGGGVIDLTTAGTGLNFLGLVPEPIRSWMLLRIGSMYQSRQETDNGIISSYPFVDSLLDPYRVTVF